MQVQIPTFNVHKDRAQGCVLPESLGSGTSARSRLPMLVFFLFFFWLALFPFFRRLESLFNPGGFTLVTKHGLAVFSASCRGGKRRSLKLRCNTS